MKYYTYEIFETVLNNFWISFKKTNKFYKISNEKTEDHISGYPDTITAIFLNVWSFCRITIYSKISFYRSCRRSENSALFESRPLYFRLKVREVKIGQRSNKNRTVSKTRHLSEIHRSLKNPLTFRKSFDNYLDRKLG